MSFYETKIGTLKKVDATKEQIIEEWLVDNELPSYYKLPEDTLEVFRDTFDGQYVENDGQVYEILNEKDLGEDDIFHLTENPDGTYNYILKYYNGGCGFDEAIEEAFINHRKGK